MLRNLSIIAALLLAAPCVAGAQQSRRPAGSAEAQAKKLYCWNEGSERICSDALPADAVNNAREEFSARSGLRSGQVQRALNEDERADAAAAEAQARLDEMALQTRQRTEQAMLSTYSSEADLRRVFSERVGILDNNINTARYNVASLRDALFTALADAGDNELAGRPVGEKPAATIRKRHGELLAQQRMQATFERQRVELDAEIEETVQRFRLLKGVTPEA
ncbi:MAG: hypothetical protein QHC77_05615 [Stenotrophomonas sp.]|uniref:hypothetical protein n=1 Tax=Stenotrophomonas sp. TaxID=69392 RepID=UPI0029A4CF68|nr:hypothetical protein [Stenotrophomonas sp.]MDX3931395.1 hypothetical protein [Stenotrophomonas sp.]